MNDIIGVWTSCFMLLFIITAIALIWMHVSIMRLDAPKDFPEFNKQNGDK